MLPSAPETTRPPAMGLAEQAAFLSSILEGCTEYGIIAKDLEGRILAWNEGARRIYGYEPGEVLGHSALMLHDPDEVQAGRAQFYMAQARATGKWEGLIPRVRKDGTRFTAQVTMTLRRNPKGNPIGFTMISRDLTEAARMEHLRLKNEELEAQNERVQQANRAKSEFLANMSHELRTPLNGIIGFAELMANGKAGPVSPRHQEFLGDILASARHLHQLINDVLDLSKVEAGKLEFRAEPLDLPRLVGEVRDVLRAVAANKRIRVELEQDASLTGLVGDASKIKQILYNFLSNALKFTPEDGLVQIRCLAEGSQGLRLEVEDTGIGIVPEDIGRLFVAFQQLDASMTKQYQGTGLGLALTKRLVEGHGGHIQVRSVPGAGSVFTAVLPRVLRLIEPGNPCGARTPGADAATLLVVEDEPAERQWLVDMLTAEGYRVEAVATGAEAVAACRERAFSAITLDILLPDMSGWEALAVIRETAINREVKVVVLTLSPGGGAGSGVLVDDLLLKPVTEERLIAALRRSCLPSTTGTVLVLEDDHAMQELARLAIEGMGLRVLVTEDGAQALQQVERERPEALVVDLLLPGMSGFEFLLRLRREAWGTGIPVIIWTEKELSEAERARLLESAQAVVAKGDTSLELLLAAIQEHCGLARQGSRHGL